MKAASVVIILLFASVLWAQQSLPDAPSAVLAQTNTTTDSAFSEASNPAPAPAPEGSSVVDRKFVALTALTFGSSIAAIEMTQRCSVQHNCYNNVFSMQDIRIKLYAIAMPIDFGATLLSYELKKRGKRWWWVPAATAIAGGTAVAIRSSQRIK